MALPALAPEQELRDLHGVRRSALAQLVADHPEVQAAGVGDVLANPTHPAVTS